MKIFVNQDNAPGCLWSKQACAQRHWNFLRELSDGHGMQFSVQQKGLQ